MRAAKAEKDRKKAEKAEKEEKEKGKKEKEKEAAPLQGPVRKRSRAETIVETPAPTATRSSIVPKPRRSKYS